MYLLDNDELSNLEAELDDAETKVKRQEIKKISTKILKKIKSTLFTDLLVIFHLKKTYGTRFLLFSTILFSLLYLVPPKLPYRQERFSGW